MSSAPARSCLLRGQPPPSLVGSALSVRRASCSRSVLASHHVATVEIECIVHGAGRVPRGDMTTSSAAPRWRLDGGRRCSSSVPARDSASAMTATRLRASRAPAPSPATAIRVRRRRKNELRATHLSTAPISESQIRESCAVRVWIFTGPRPLATAAEHPTSGAYNRRIVDRVDASLATIRQRSNPGIEPPPYPSRRRISPGSDERGRASWHMQGHVALLVGLATSTMDHANALCPRT